MPNKCFVITVRQLELEFVSEEYSGPLLSIQALLVTVKGRVGTEMTWRQSQMDDGFQLVQVYSM